MNWNQKQYNIQLYYKLADPINSPNTIIPHLNILGTYIIFNLTINVYYITVRVSI